MIFACGVRRIRLISDSVSGCASRSARAARSIAAAAIRRGGLSALPEVAVLLILGCPPGRNNANAFLTFGVSHKQHHVAFSIMSAPQLNITEEHRLRRQADS